MRLPKTVVWAGLIGAYAIGSLMLWKQGVSEYIRTLRKASTMSDELDVASKGSY